MTNKHKFLIWLVDTLQRKELSKEEIIAAWDCAAMNDTKSSISHRTFERYKADLYQEFGWNVTYNAYSRKYSIEKEDMSFEQSSLYDWLMSAMRLRAFIDSKINNDIVMLESAPSGSEHLLEVVRAIKESKIIRLSYQSFYWDEPRSFRLCPAFIRLFDRRWYVIGKVAEENKLRTYALERVKELEVLEDKKYTFTHKEKKALEPTEYFRNAYGIMREGAPLSIRFRVLSPQDKYIREIPLHSSQKEISKNETYTDFEVFVCPSFDFRQAVLAQGAKLVILSPQSFREEIQQELREMLESYEQNLPASEKE